MKVILLMLMCALDSGTNLSLFDEISPTEAGTFERTMSTKHKVSVTFIGIVKSIELLGRRELDVNPVDSNPRFALTVHIESGAPQDVSLKEGTDQVFAIHSPAILFRGKDEEAIGRKYRFKVTWEKVGNTSRFSRLTASQIEGEDAKVVIRERRAALLYERQPAVATSL